MTEQSLLQFVRDRILSIREGKSKPVRIAINGIEGTGKTVFAKTLTEYLNTQDVKAIHVSIDGFHFNKEVRYRQGRNSAKGYYEDSYDEMAFVEKVLKSSQSEIPAITKAIHDLETDEYLSLEATAIDNDTVLVTDGAYLFKPNYREHWDLKIYLKTSFAIAMSRGIERDQASLGGFDQTKEKYEKRYHQASRIYIKENEPEEIADMVIDFSDFDSLILLKGSAESKTQNE